MKLKLAVSMVIALVAGVLAGGGVINFGIAICAAAVTLIAIFGVIPFLAWFLSAEAYRRDQKRSVQNVPFGN